MTKKNEKIQAAQIKASNGASIYSNRLYIGNTCVYVCERVCVLGPESDFREQRVYKVKCDLCGAAVPRQVEKDPETREVRQPQRNGGWGGNQVFLKISAIWTSRTSPPRRVNSELNLSTTAQDKHVCHQRFWAETVFYTGSPPYSVNVLLWKLRN